MQFLSSFNNDLSGTTINMVNGAVDTLTHSANSNSDVRNSSASHRSNANDSIMSITNSVSNTSIAAHNEMPNQMPDQMPPLSDPSQHDSENVNDNANPDSFFERIHWDPSCRLYTMDHLGQSNPANLILDPKVEKGFFIRDGKWTCFRRNHFQVALDLEFEFGSSLNSSASSKQMYLVQDGLQVKIQRFFVTVQAHGALSFSHLKIYQSSSVSNHTDVSPIDFSPQQKARVSFRRLQFNQSTPANTNRHYADRFFSISLQVHCVGEDCVTRKLAECHSSKLIVLSGTPGQYKKEGSSPSSAATNGAGKQMKRVVRPFALHSHRPTNSAPSDFYAIDLAARCFSPPTHRSSHSFDFTQQPSLYSTMPSTLSPTLSGMSSQLPYSWNQNDSMPLATSITTDPPLFSPTISGISPQSPYSLNQNDSVQSATSIASAPPLFSPTNSPAPVSAYPISLSSTPKPDLDAFFNEFTRQPSPTKQQEFHHLSSYIISPEQNQSSPLLSGAPTVSNPLSFPPSQHFGMGDNIDFGDTFIDESHYDTTKAAIQDFFYDFNN